MFLCRLQPKLVTRHISYNKNHVTSHEDLLSKAELLQSLSCLFMSGCVQRCLNLGGTPLLQQQPLQAVIAAAQEHNKPHLGALAANFKSVASTLADTDADRQRPGMSVLWRAGVPAYMPAMEMIGCRLGPHNIQPMANALRTIASNLIKSAVTKRVKVLDEDWVRSLLDCLHYHA